MAGATSNPVAQSGKCSSILDYLDEVSDDPPRRGYTKPVPRVPDMFDAGTSSLSISSTSTSPQQQQRRRRRRPHNDGEESKLGGGGETRAPWDNSIKDTRALKTASSTRHDSERRSREAADIEQRGQPSTTRGRTEAAPDGTTTRQRRGVVIRHYSASVRGDPSPLSGADRKTNGGGNRASSEQAVDDSSSTAETEAPTTTVGGIAQQQQRQRRWVWDEWEDNVGGTSSVPPCSRDQTTINSGSRTSSNGSPVPPRLSPSARTVAGAGSVGESPRAKRDKHAPPHNSDDDECTPAARRAFEDIQATAQSMKANLKQERSEV